MTLTGAPCAEQPLLRVAHALLEAFGWRAGGSWREIVPRGIVRAVPTARLEYLSVDPRGSIARRLSPFRSLRSALPAGHPPIIFMPTKREIEAQIRALGQIDTFGTKKEIAFLPEVLHDDESVLALVSGLLDGNTWLIVCTEKRVVFLDKGMLFGLKQRETLLSRVNSIEQKEGLMFGTLGIQDGAEIMTITMIEKGQVRPFANAVSMALKGLDAGKEPTKGVPEQDLATQLERLAGLRDRGILTEAEFQDQKAKALS